MELPEITVSVKPLVIDGAATAFVLQFDAGSEELTRINLQTWWSAPERAREAGFTAPDLPPEWVTVWHRYWSRRVRFLPFIRRWPPHDEVRVWPGAVGFIRSAPRGEELPWVIGVESGLSMALAGDEGLGIVMLRQGVSRERAGQALLAGEQTTPEQFFTYPAEEETCAAVERLYRRSGWVFVILDVGRVLAVNQLQVEQPGRG